MSNKTIDLIWRNLKLHEGEQFLTKKGSESAMTTLCCLTHRAPFQNGKLKKPWVFRLTPLLLTENTKVHLISFRCFMTPGSYPRKQFIRKLDRGFFEAKIEFPFLRAFVSNGGNSYAFGISASRFPQAPGGERSCQIRNDFRETGKRCSSSFMLGLWSS